MNAVALIYWLCWLLWAFVGAGYYYFYPAPAWYGPGRDVLLVVLLFIIGIVVFPLR